MPSGISIRRRRESDVGSSWRTRRGFVFSDRRRRRCGPSGPFCSRMVDAEIVWAAKDLHGHQRLVHPALGVTTACRDGSTGE